MNEDPAILTANGIVDRDGRLVAADPRLLALHRQAGGEEGGVLVIPQIATLVRLAQTLGVMVSRSLTVADGDEDFDLSVRAYPENNDIRLVVGGWSQRVAEPPSADIRSERARYFAQFDEDGHWETDNKLNFTSLPNGFAEFDTRPEKNAGAIPLSRLFRLVEDEAGDLPMLIGLAARMGFVGQILEPRCSPVARLRLHGEPIFDDQGLLAGYAGSYAMVDGINQQSATAPTAVGVPDPKSGFAARLDGALRLPIAQIIANADEISARSNGPIRQDYATYASDISSAGRHLLGLIDDISDLQAIEQPDFKIALETVDLADIARRGAGLLRVRAMDNKVKIDAPAIDEILEAKGDFRRVLQIIVNLVGNAVRYSPEGANVWIRTECEGDLAAVIIADQGKGIAVADQVRIFEKFERLDPSESAGSGLGLFISRRLALAMGGDLNVDSAPGQGSRFILTLPIV